MAIRAVLGCQYGDEGKAKLVDVLSADVDVIVRFQGGSNAGHTIQFNNQKHVLHLIPSGIFHENQICVLASGVVIDPFQLEKEMKNLLEKSVVFEDRFFIDERAAVVLPIHKVLDEQNENLSAEKKIGTTKRGIGPCYADIASRIAVRMNDLSDKDNLSNKIAYIYKFHNITITKDELTKQVNELFDFGLRMKDSIVNLPYVIDTLVKEKKKILFEGAQGTLLDVYFGTYPYVTSSHTVAGVISASVGLSPRKVDEYIGAYKSYFTRVGEGPFPTELFDDIGKRIQTQGNEFGSTTGRPRRCGWFDAVSARFSAMINGIDTVALTLLDVLSGIETLKICVGYDIDGQVYTEFPSNISHLESAKPIYIELPGWDEDISKCTSWKELPKNAKSYVYKIEELILTPVKIISVGPSREQTIFL